MKKLNQAAIAAISKETGIDPTMIFLVGIVFNAKHEMSGKGGVHLMEWSTAHPVSRSGFVKLIERKGESLRVKVSVFISEAVKEAILHELPEKFKA